jgi:hypothetical protein
MRQYYYLSFLILLFSTKISSSNFIQDDGLKAYLILSFKNPEMFKDSTSKHIIESEIKNIFKNEGIHIIQEEKPEEYKLTINIQIGDSLIIEQKSIGVGGISIVIVKHPRVSYPYKNTPEIYDSIKSYIKNNF